MRATVERVHPSSLSADFLGVPVDTVTHEGNLLALAGCEC